MQVASHASPFHFADRPARLSSSRVWTGRILSSLLVVLLAFDSITKLIREPHTVAAASQMGISESIIVQIGVILALCLCVYLVPRLSIVGAVLLTGYLGGATATNLIVGQSFIMCLFPVIVGALIWLGLFLRDDRVRGIFAPRA
jgi:uncharacterized membrane protein (UPF0182 family)